MMVKVKLHKVNGALRMTKISAGQIVSLQFAVNGEWENAIAFPKYKMADLSLWLDKAPTDIAVEIFLDGKNAQQFLGIRLASLSLEQRKVFCLECCNFFFASEYQNIDDFLEFARLYLKQPSLFSQEADFFELGAVNNWKPFQPVRFWPDVNHPNAKAAFVAALNTNTRYLDKIANPVAIEFAYSSPLPHWLGVIVSEKHQDQYRLDQEKALKILT